MACAEAEMQIDEKAVAQA